VDVEGAGGAFIVGGTLDFGSTANPFAYGNSISAEGGALVRLGGLAIFDSDDDLPVDGSLSMEIGSAGAASTANVPASTPVWLAVTVNVIGPVQARIEHLALLAGF